MLAYKQVKLSLYLGLDKYIQIRRLDVHDDTFDKIRKERFDLRQVGLSNMWL